MSLFHAVGVDLAWGDHPSGVAHLVAESPRPTPDQPWRLQESRTLPSTPAVIAWLLDRVPDDAAAWIAVDAPLLATNPAGTQRSADLALTADFRRFRVMCLPVDTRHAERGSQLRAALAERGFRYLPPDDAPRRGLLETFPTAAHLSLFDVRRPIPYKRGAAAQRREGMRSLQLHLAMLEDAALPLAEGRALKELLRTDPGTLGGVALKALEDRLDAMLCALVAALAFSAPRRLATYGDAEQGFITVPHAPASVAPDPPEAAAG